MNKAQAQMKVDDILGNALEAYIDLPTPQLARAMPRDEYEQRVRVAAMHARLIRDLVTAREVLQK